MNTNEDRANVPMTLSSPGLLLGTQESKETRASEGQRGREA